MFAPLIKRISVITHRNEYGLKNIPSLKKQVNVESFPLNNIGDTLGPVIANWMLEKKGLSNNYEVGYTKHLMSVGSIVSFGYFDATVWGSGIINEDAFSIIKRKKNILHRKMDVRAVRGPITREALRKAGYTCPEIYGDPAILLPMLYTPTVQKKYDVSVILHYKTNTDDYLNDIKNAKEDALESSWHFIDPKTNDYKKFIDEICASKFVISSSLHGIIIAEAYGIPARFLIKNMSSQLTKFSDWYLSTGREAVYYQTIEEALNGDIPSSPDLKMMQEGLINSFPYDLWEE